MYERIASNEELLKALRNGARICYFGELEHLPAELVVEEKDGKLDVAIKFRRPFQGIVVAMLKRGTRIYDINIASIDEYSVEAHVHLNKPRERGEYTVQVTYSGTMLYNIARGCIEERPCASPQPRGVTTKVRIE